MSTVPWTVGAVGVDVGSPGVGRKGGELVGVKKDEVPETATGQKRSDDPTDTTGVAHGLDLHQRGGKRPGTPPWVTTPG